MGKKKKVSKHLNVSSASPSHEFNRSTSMPAEKFSKATRGIPMSPEEGAIAEHGCVLRQFSDTPFLNPCLTNPYQNQVIPSEIDRLSSHSIT